jgi:hypothetical protein
MQDNIMTQREVVSSLQSGNIKKKKATNQNCIHEEFKIGLKLGKACNHSIQNYNVVNISV